MLANHKNQEIFATNAVVATTLSTASANYLQIDTLFAAQGQIQDCINTNQNLFATNFGQEQKIRIDATAWLELRNTLVNIEKNLYNSLNNAQDMLNNSVESFDPNTAKQGLANWAKDTKRFFLLDLLNEHKLNPELITAIDEAFLEDPEDMLAFTTANIRNDLLSLLEEQIKDFSILVKKAELAVSQEQQEEVLQELLGDMNSSDDLLFDVFASGFSAMKDFEISFAVIATYMVLCS